jgi:GDPmannose 4,6-dehydratase
MAFAEVGAVLEFRGEGVEEKGYVVASNNPDFPIEIGKEVVAVDAAYFRPTEVDLLIGDPTKSKTKLGWKPKYDLPMLVNDMVSSDVRLFQREKLLKESGFDVNNQYE